MSHDAKVQVTPALSSVIRVTETDTQVEVTKPVTTTVSLTATGPQGPSFTGDVFFDTDAIGALNSGDVGKVLYWNGSLWAPTDVLEDDLTLYGGAF